MSEEVRADPTLLAGEHAGPESFAEDPELAPFAEVAEVDACDHPDDGHEEEGDAEGCGDPQPPRRRRMTAGGTAHGVENPASSSSFTASGDRR